MRVDIANEILNNLNATSESEPLLIPLLHDLQLLRDELTVKDILLHYANYHNKLTDDDKIKLSTLFWSMIKTVGTPIIEKDLQEPNKCRVHFLFPKDQLENDNTLYLQGAFHGYGGIRERNQLSELADTGILYRIDTLPLNAILNYQYQQNGASALNDDYSFHRNVYHHRYSGGIVLRVNADPVKSLLGEHLGNDEEKYWDRITASAVSDQQTNFTQLVTLYTDTNNTLQTCDAPLPQKVDIYNPVPPNLAEIPDEDLTNSPYANFTRAIHIFLPRCHPTEINNIIVFNDGRPYILAGMVEQAKRMIKSGNLPANTALIFITTLQGLINTMPGIQHDERFKLSGMGVRTIDFQLGIDNYVSFLKSVFQQLEHHLKIPNNASYRTIVGASLSGTATLCIALKEPGLFNSYIAQSPSPSNDAILIDLQANRNANVQLSCGVFEQPSYNDTETDCFNYARELAQRFDIPFDEEKYHGHNHAAWIQDLETAIPKSLMKRLNKSPESASIFSQSIFYQSKESSIKIENKNETIQVLRKKGG